MVTHSTPIRVEETNSFPSPAQSPSSQHPLSSSLGPDSAVKFILRRWLSLSTTMGTAVQAEVFVRDSRVPHPWHSWGYSLYKMSTYVFLSSKQNCWVEAAAFRVHWSLKLKRFENQASQKKLPDCNRKEMLFPLFSWHEFLFITFFSPRRPKSSASHQSEGLVTFRTRGQLVNAFTSMEQLAFT